MKLTLNILFPTFLTFFSAILEANMGVILIIPKDAKVVIGIYSGISKASSVTEIESTNSAIDGQSFNLNNSALTLGGMVGVQNDYYRFSFSYDINNDADIQMRRALINFDFKIGEKDSFRPMLGFGVGVATNTYDINSKKVKQGNGVLSFRAGTEYVFDKTNSLEILLEYSYLMTNGLGKSFYEGSDFTTYNIREKDDITLRVGYNF